MMSVMQCVIMCMMSCGLILCDVVIDGCQFCRKKKLELCKDFERSSCAKNFGDNCDNQSSNQGLGVWSPETLH